MIDEGPSPQDLERFDRSTASCPECGAQMWDQAEICPSCGEWVVAGRPPLKRSSRRGWIVLVAAIVLVAFLVAVLSGVF
ncbi:MAG: hypothetical protein ACYS0G_08405 [Planctomycetota bacterium]|jgi:uncharacterized paraquat-inducible protein A